MSWAASPRLRGRRGTPAGAPVPAAASSSQGSGSGLVAAIAAAAALMLGGLLGVLTSRRRTA
ncbi:MAG: hypothetical protein WKF40_04115 [Thermoleophilaceae bacterium]